MKISLKTADLARALYRVQGVADKKSTMASLAYVHLSAQGTTLVVSATDMEVGLSATYEATVSTAGMAAIQARQLYDVVKNISAETVELTKQDNHWVEIKAGQSRFKLAGMPADEYPALPTHAHTKTFSIPAQELVRMIDRTLFCVSTDDNRHNLSGIYCESPKPNTLRLVATDGHRLAMAEKVFECEIPIERGVIIPKKGFQELKRVLEGSNNQGFVELGFTGNSGVIKAGSAVLTTRLVEGQFPDYEQVVPKTAAKIAKIRKSTFAEALKRVLLFAQSRANGVRLVFDNGSLELIAEDPEMGDAHETIEVDYKGDQLVIGFNARYLLDALALIGEEGLVFELSDDLSPGVVRPIEDRGFLAVVMPMRI